MIRICFVFLISLFITACGTMNNALVEKTKQYEYYRIYDIKTSSDEEIVIDAASDGLGANVADANEARPILSSQELPEKPGRFKLTSPFAGTAFGALAAQGGSVGFKVANCDGAVWTANAVREVTLSYTTNLQVCLFPYKEGYHLDIYAQMTKKEGGLLQISRAMANAAVGTPEEWTEKTFLDIAREIQKKTNAEINFVEGYPKVKGTPWLDSGDKFTQK